jgi:DNA/RNA endonuclease G (NUC1)
MLPMPTPLRFGAWLRLEQTVNALVARKGELHVITGPVYFNNLSPEDDSSERGVDLMGYFKIVAGDSGFAAFVFPQDLGLQESFCGQLASLDEIERLTKLKLFPEHTPTQSEQLLVDLGCTP